VLDRGKAKAAPMKMADSAAGKEEGKALKGKEKAPRPHPLLYGVLWVSASARQPLLGLPGGYFCEGRAIKVCRGAAEESIRDRESTLSAHLSAHRGPPGLVATIGDPLPRSIRRTAHLLRGTVKAALRRIGSAARPERRCGGAQGIRPTPQLHLYRPIKQARSYAPHGTRTLAERGAGTPKSPGLGH
jgi:hypothetical protein